MSQTKHTLAEDDEIVSETRIVVFGTEMVIAGTKKGITLLDGVAVEKSTPKESGSVEKPTPVV